MKVVLKETIIDRLVQKFAEASRDDREVDYIVVSDSEFCDLCRDLRSHRYLTHKYATYSAATGTDMVIQTRDFKRRVWSRNAREVIRVAEHGAQFMGKAIFVVPQEYMPA